MKTFKEVCDGGQFCETCFNLERRKKVLTALRTAWSEIPEDLNFICPLGKKQDEQKKSNIADLVKQAEVIIPVITDEKIANRLNICGTCENNHGGTCKKCHICGGSKVSEVTTLRMYKCKRWNEA